MEQKDKRKLLTPIADFALVFSSVAVVALTYITVSGLSPNTKQDYLNNNQQVLGATTEDQKIQVFPGDETNLPYLNGITINTGTNQSSSSQVTAQFTKLEDTSYSFRIASIKNQAQNSQSIRITPSYSLQGNFVRVTLTYAGIEQEILTTDGTVQPLDISIPANTIADITLTIQPAVRLATETELSLDFTKTW